jgi:aspartyl-tRNA(Asn)/glutamyl-tRNA(Gln) amidotransferase subunit B
MATIPKIGLEIHAYLDTNEKLFCTCKVQHGAKHAKPNTNICPICTGQPGCKPQLPNNEAIKKAIQIGLILNCKINEKIIFQRKHYSWPDNPKGYQNTISGYHAIPNAEKGKFLEIGITECHVEEDPAAWNPETGEIDYNRSGSPLIEIVTDPDFKSSEQVIEWLKQLTTTLGYIKAIDKKAGLKADVNVSINNGTRIEIKNINSLTNIKNAIESEISRQEKDPPKEQETRMFNSKKNQTIKMRSKENAQDYRFISDPDLPQIKIEKSEIQKIKSQLPETPHEKLDKLIKKHKIPKHSAELLTKNIDIVELFEKTVSKIKPSIAITWTIDELLGVLNHSKKSLGEVNISHEHFIELLELVERKTLTPLKAKDLLRQFIPKSFSPKTKAKSQAQISDKSQVNKLAEKAIKENPKAVEDYKSGNQNSLNFLIGSVMKTSNKRADYKVVRELLEKMLK